MGRLGADGARSLRFRWCDNANLVRAKAVHLPSLRDRLGTPSPEALAEALAAQVTICQSQMAIPVVADEVVADAGLPPVHDVTLRPDWSTLSEIPHAPGHLWVDVDMVDGGEPWGHCPRGFLRRMEAAAARAGLDVSVGVELELHLLAGPADAAGGGPVPADRAPFALDRAFDQHLVLVDAILDSLTGQGIAVAQHHPESGPGQYEISLAPRSPLAAADAVVSARETIRAVAREHGSDATFLPVLRDGSASSSMHLHLSLTDDPADGLGPAGPAFVAGLLDHLIPLLAATCPSPNSYRRFRPRSWVGAYTAWGYENKEVPLRVVRARSGGARDVELKAVDGTANPYVALGGVLAAGLDGIGRGLVPPPPLGVDPADLDDAARAEAGVAPLPREPGPPLDAFERSAVLATAMGDLHRSYTAVKRHEHARLAGLDLEAEVAALVGRY